jgi:tetratricopeptide (TPR) repeat protein
MADKPVKYNPAPKAFDANTVQILIRATTGDYYKNLAYNKVVSAFGQVAQQLMEEAVGLFPHPVKEDRWCKPTFTGDMAKDPYLVHLSTYVDKRFSSDSQKMEYLKEWAVDMRDAGAWTIHSETGGQLGVLGSSHNLRVNPVAMMSVLSILPTNNRSYPEMSAVPGMPGWRYLAKEDEERGGYTKTMAAYEDWQAGRLKLAANGNRIIFLDKMEKFRPHQAFMEGVLQNHDIRLDSREVVGDLEFFSQLFKDVPPVLLAQKLYDRDALKKFHSSLENAQEEYQKALKTLRELRDIRRKFDSVGSIEDVLDAMGRNLEEALLQDATSWLNMDTEDNWRQEHPKFCKSLAKEFLGGELILSTEKPKEATHA